MAATLAIGFDSAFALSRVRLAGTTFTVHVQSGWTRARLNGQSAGIPVRIPRSAKSCRI